MPTADTHNGQTNLSGHMLQYTLSEFNYLVKIIHYIYNQQNMKKNRFMDAYRNASDSLWQQEKTKCPKPTTTSQ